MSRSSIDFEDTDMEDQVDFDVVITGAGLSGLTAGDRLISAGINVIILEKTDSAGGRVLSNKESELFYAHDLQGRLNVMMQRLKISKRRQKYPNIKKIIHLTKNKILNDSLPFYVVGEVYYFIKTIETASQYVNFKTYRDEKTNEQFSNVSMEDILYKLVFFKKSRSICRNLIYVTCSITHLDSVSALWYLAILNGAGGFLQRLRVNLGDSNRYFIQGGAINLAQLLSKRIKASSQIHYNESVYKIQFNDDRAHVWTNKGHYKCNYVIIAIPPTECSRIIIEPQLPVHLKKAHSSFGHGKNVFFHGTFSQFYRFNVLTKNIVGAENNKVNLRLAYDATCADEKYFHVSGYLSQPIIDPIIRDNVMSLMNQYFSSNTLHFQDYKETDWTSISGGSPMDVLKPGSLKYYLNLLSETHGRIFFAASEYANNWPGTIDGAIEAGEYTACSVLERIRPQSINHLEWILYKYIPNFYYHVILLLEVWIILYK